jgi:peptidoglycan/LPS O-acetylase OafA/YrhL
LLFLYRDRIPYSRAAALVAFPFAIFLIFLSQETGIEGFSYLAVPGLIYTVAVVGLTSLPKIPLLSDGDYSYGVYIYGFPIQQSVAYFLPQFRFWWVNLAIALPLVLIVAVCSWNFVEKPFLGLRKRVAISIRPSGESDGTLSPIRKIAWYLGLSIYCLFVLDANSVLPVRPIAKSVLSQVGLYHYPDQ